MFVFANKIHDLFNTGTDLLVFANGRHKKPLLERRGDVLEGFLDKPLSLSACFQKVRIAGFSLDRYTRPAPYICITNMQSSLFIFQLLLRKGKLPNAVSGCFFNCSCIVSKATKPAAVFRDGMVTTHSNEGAANTSTGFGANTFANAHAAACTQPS